MASLTETANQSRGQTVLYLPGARPRRVPTPIISLLLHFSICCLLLPTVCTRCGARTDEDLSIVDRSAKDKDLVQRLEAILIHWTRQIKEVRPHWACAHLYVLAHFWPTLAVFPINHIRSFFVRLPLRRNHNRVPQVVGNQQSSHSVDNDGPLEEIKFWSSRTVDLSGIRQQLERPGVKAIVSVLRAAGSSYLEVRVPQFSYIFNARTKTKSSFQRMSDKLMFVSCFHAPRTDSFLPTSPRTSSKVHYAFSGAELAFFALP